MGNKTVKNVGIILGCSIVAKILSFVWEATLAAFLGASDQADALYMTTSIFNVLYPILDMGIWKVFLPAYKTKLVEKNEDKAAQIADIAVTLFFALSVALVLFLIVFARPIVGIMAPGFNAAKKAITIKYLRISAPTYFLMASASIVGAMLQSRDKFFGSQIREIGTHVSKIAYIFICYRFMGIYAAVTAFIVGSIFRLLIQLPFIDWKWKFRPNFNFKDEDVVPMIKGLPSVAITAAISQINGVVDKVVASGAESGSIACLNYGHKLMNVFSGMISSAIATAVYPTIIQYVAEKDESNLKELLKNVVCTLCFIIIPISFFCIIYSNDMVTVAFQRGAFNESASLLTSNVFSSYCIGMLFIAIATIITNVFYAYGDTKITMYISIVEIILNVVFNLIFIRFWGVPGLAVATSVSAVICLGVRIILLRRYIEIEYGKIVLESLKIILISIVACVVPAVVFTKLLSLNVFVSLLLSALAFGGIYIGLSLLFKLNTMNFALDLFRKKTGRRV